MLALQQAGTVNSSTQVPLVIHRVRRSPSKTSMTGLDVALFLLLRMRTSAPHIAIRTAAPRAAPAMIVRWSSLSEAALAEEMGKEVFMIVEVAIVVHS